MPGVVLHTVYESPPVPGPVDVPGLREVSRVASVAHLEAVRSAGCQVTPVRRPRLSVEAEVAREGGERQGGEGLVVIFIITCWLVQSV